jgi:hypothetical protein
MVPEGGSEVPIPPQHSMVVVAGYTIGTVEFELHVPNWLNHVCDTGCVPRVGVGRLEAVLWYQRVGSEVPIPPQHMVVVAEQLER